MNNIITIQIEEGFARYSKVGAIQADGSQKKVIFYGAVALPESPSGDGQFRFRVFAIVEEDGEDRVIPFENLHPF